VPDEAKKHFEAILQFDSNNKAAANQVVICNAKIREQREKDKKLYSSIFNKMVEKRSTGKRSEWRQMALYGWWDESTKGVHLPAGR
jgi:FK506-binding protein 4/5